MSKVIYLPPAAKYLKKIKDKHLKKAFQNAVNEILLNPQIGSPKTGDLSGIYGYDIYYNKTNYELAYQIEVIDETVVIVILAGTRENFYEQLKRYMK